MYVTWILLTYNRANAVEKSLTHNRLNMGNFPLIDLETVWCDNGSTDGTREVVERIFRPDVSILNRENQGVAKGYNVAMGLARGTHVVITGCDMLMPDGWLEKMVRCFETIPKTGIVTIYASPIDSTPERIRGPRERKNGILIQPAMPIGRRMLSRELLREIGYFHEGFGMYGWDDVFWGHRAERVCKEKGLSFYNLPDMVAEHLGTEGNVGYDHKDEHEYWRWKKSQVDDPKKQELLRELERAGWPKFTPF